MALVVKDRVKETSTSIGTGNFTLAGAVDGFQSFSAALANGDTTYYAITDAGTGDFEVGLGTYNAGVITRTTILESTNAGAAVNFQAGEKEVFITYPAEKAVYADASGNISVPGLVDGRDLAADGSKLDGIEAGATADQTASEILTAIKTVDGAASGLDADLLDGQEGSYYTGYTDTAAAAKVSKTGDTMTGALDVQSTITADGLTVDGPVTINSGDITFQNSANTNYLKLYADTESLFTAASPMPIDPLGDTFSGYVTGSTGMIHSTELDPGDGETTTPNDTIGSMTYYKINASAPDTTTDIVWGRLNVLQQQDSSETVGGIVGAYNYIDGKLGKSSAVSGGFNISRITGSATSQTISHPALRSFLAQALFNPDDTASNNTITVNNMFGVQATAVAYGSGTNNIINITNKRALFANQGNYLYTGSSGSTLNITENVGAYISFYNRDYVSGASTLNITNQYGLQVANTYEIAGSVGTMYGVHVGDFSNSATTFYNFYGAAGDAYFGGNLETTGNITVGGTVDGRDIAADGTKLDGIEAGATADQTKADIDALGIDAATLGGNTAAYFTGYTDTAVAALVDAAPGTLDTLNELAAALGDDPNFATTVTNSIATKLPLAGGTMTGNITFNSTQLFDGRDVSADGAKLDGIEAGATADQTITAGAGLTGGGTGNVTLSHADTSAQASVNNSNGTVIQDVTLDTYGHVTGLASVDLDSRYAQVYKGDATLSTAANSYVELFKFSRANGAHTFILHTTVSDSAFSVSKSYLISAKFAGTGGAWQILNPTSDSGPYSGNDYRIEIVSSGQDTSIRAVRVSGSIVGTLSYEVHAVYDALNQSYTVLSGTGTSTASVYYDNNTTADKLTTARNIALTGAVTGNANFDGSGNISIATTATSDPTLTINGDASGSATFTNLGNATLTLTIADDSHNHVISNVDGLQAALDGKLNLSGGTLTGDLSFGTQTGTWIASNAMSDSIGWNPSYGVYIGSNTLGYNSFLRGNGTFTSNTGTHTLWHAGNDGSGSGLDADLLDGQQGSYYYSPANPPPAGGAVGGGSDEIFWENDQVVTTSYTITNGKNAGSFGPITINSGVTVTVGPGEVWTVI